MNCHYIVLRFSTNCHFLTVSDRGGIGGTVTTFVGFGIYMYYLDKCGFKDTCSIPLVFGFLVAVLCIALLLAPGPHTKWFRKGVVSVGMKDSSGGLGTKMKWFTFIPSGAPTLNFHCSFCSLRCHTVTD